MTATPSPNLNDQSILATNTLFLARVQEAMVATCIAITTEAATVAFHWRRFAFAVSVLNSPTSYQQLFANGVATDALCIGDATVAGTVPLTGANAAAQQALVTDPHINAAIAGQFNSFFSPF